MELFFILLLAVSYSSATPSQSFTLNDDNSYRFQYDTGAEGGSQSRQESRSVDGTVIGKYTYLDPSGSMREVRYQADNNGYMPFGDVAIGAWGTRRFGPIRPYDSELKNGEKSEPEATTEKSEDEPNSETDTTTTVQPDKVEDTKNDEMDQDLGFFALSLGGKRRLDIPSDTGKLDAPPESARKPPIIYNPVVVIPPSIQSKQSFSPFFTPVIYQQRMPYFPIIPTFFNRRFQTYPGQSYFHYQYGQKK